jgi:hypothetical protein
MRTIPLRNTFLFVPLCVLGLLLLGCGGGSRDKDDQDEDTKTTSSGKKSGSSSSSSERKPISSKELVPIAGVIKLEAAKPNLADLTAKLQAGMTQDKDYCLKGKEGETSYQEYRIGDNNQVGNVFVWIEPETGYYFEISEAQLKEVQQKPTPRIHQPHCAFIPHCEVLFPKYIADGKGTLKPTGQKLIVENDAQVSHNTMTLETGKNNPMNFTLKAGKQDERVFNPDPNPIVVKCNIHPWMTGYLRAFNHPYATVSAVGKDAADPEYGTWKIAQAPLGAKVRIFAWHEKAGFLTDPKGESIEITKDTKPIDFKMTKAP